MQLCKHFLISTSSDWIEFHEYITPYNALLLVCEFHEHITPYNVFLLVWNQDTWFLMTHTWSYQLSTAFFFFIRFHKQFCNFLLYLYCEFCYWLLINCFSSKWLICTRHCQKSDNSGYFIKHIVIYFSLAAK